jgi:hypothetical protein
MAATLPNLLLAQQKALIVHRKRDGGVQGDNGSCLMKNATNYSNASCARDLQRLTQLVV